MNAVAADCGISRKTVESHFDRLEDLLLAVRIPVFRRRAKRRTTTHPKFSIEVERASVFRERDLDSLRLF